LPAGEQRGYRGGSRWSCVTFESRHFPKGWVVIKGAEDRRRSIKSHKTKVCTMGSRDQMDFRLLIVQRRKSAVTS
jgi:hypothetical protein